MKKLMVVLIGVVCLLGSSVSAATMPVTSNDSSGNINLPGLWANYNSHNWGDTSWASVNFTLENCIPGNASWNFFTYLDDTSKWDASLHLCGHYLGDELAPDDFKKNQSSNINFSDVHLGSRLDIRYSQEDAFLTVYGSYNISPSVIDSANFFYSEFGSSGNDKIWWSLDYYVRGKFIADTLAEAQAMGAPFVQAVPEPATICLLGLGSGLAFISRHRRNG